MQTLKMTRLKTLVVVTEQIASMLNKMQDFIAGRNFYRTMNLFKMYTKQRQNKIWWKIFGGKVKIFRQPYFPTYPLLTTVNLEKHADT